jgi:hypothetical protein
MADLVEVYRDARSEFAKLVTLGLQQQGLRATLVGEGLSGIVGAGAVAVPARVLVPAPELESATAMVAVLLAEMNQEPSSEGLPEHCPNCGAEWEAGFSVCWQCEYALPSR